ncbi:hypothetical protein BT69DRAFT_1277323 [Atractiella rhizophila]|nr:hypothetical protein BT69DRAFT_1277323 [Atractiella rhizophila]
MAPPRGSTKSRSAQDTPQSGTPGPAVQSPAETLSYSGAPRPWKNPNFTKYQDSRNSRKNKNLKQILTQERERAAAIRAEREAKKNSTAGEDVVMEDQEDGGDWMCYHNYQAPPSLLPPKKYCDVTGLEAKYVDPKTQLRYHSVEIYEVIKGFHPHTIQSYLELRGRGVVLR